VTEAEARAALAPFDGLGGLEGWVASQRWERIPGGWRVRGRFAGRHFRVEPAAGGLRVAMSARGGEPVVWFVPGQEHSAAALPDGSDVQELAPGAIEAQARG
jgi:hypothetical protein